MFSVHYCPLLTSLSTSAHHLLHACDHNWQQLWQRNVSFHSDVILFFSHFFPSLTTSCSLFYALRKGNNCLDVTSHVFAISSVPLPSCLAFSCLCESTSSCLPTQHTVTERRCLLESGRSVASIHQNRLILLG